MIDPKPAPLDKVSEVKAKMKISFRFYHRNSFLQTINTSQTKELSESELIKEIQMGSQARYV